MAFLKYFQSYKNYFWQWEEEHQVITIPEAYTIAYLEFVTEILEYLAPQGFPPFGSLLLAITATNPKGREGINTLNNRNYAIRSDEEYKEYLEAINFLIILSKLPEAYKVGDKRLLLFQIIFRNCHNGISVKNSMEILKWLKSTSSNDSGNILDPIVCTEKIVKRDFRPFSLLGRKYPDVSSLLEELAALPEITFEDLALEPTLEKEANASKDFIDDLIEDNDTFYVGALVKRIWSGLNIPFHSSLPSEQPLGGIADITNKGDFNKLLLSEFANDDITLMSRLANNEALYFHREIPPADNNLQRVILMDFSLKNWGTIKTMAFATLLAIAKHPKTDIECLAFSVGKKYQEVKFDTIHEVIHSLQQLESSLDAVQGLELFFKDYKLKNREVILITNAETQQHPEMQKLLSEQQGKIDYWIHPAVDGSLSLHKKQAGGKKFCQTIKLPLNELWRRENKVEQHFVEENIPNYPILFPNPYGEKKMFCDDTGTICKITREKALLRLFNPQKKHLVKGWEMIDVKIPTLNGEFAIGRNEAREEILLIYEHQNRKLSLVNLKTKETKSTVFDNWSSTRYKEFFFIEKAFYFFAYSCYFEISLDGEITPVNEWEDDFLELFKKRKEAQEKLRRQYHFPMQVFKNIKTVFINEDHHLVFNIHKLFVNSGSVLKLEKNIKLKRLKLATRITKGQFVFRDGSTITLNPAGMLTLKSSAADIPTIYVPCVLEMALGAATESEFTGNEYYLKPSEFQVFFLKPITEKIQAIKTIRRILDDIGLQDLKELIDAAPRSRLPYCSQQKAIALQKELENIGIETRFTTEDWRFSKTIPPVFYERYIKAFVQNILNNAPED